MKLLVLLFLKSLAFIKSENQIDIMLSAHEIVTKDL